MQNCQNILTINTKPKSFTNITETINSALTKFNISKGLCNLFIQHTSCSLIISENYDPDVLLDLETFMSKLVPEGFNYRHSAEGKDDMPAHIRSVLTQTSISIPVIDNQLALGTWQAVYLWEHRDHAHYRKVQFTIIES